MLGLCVPCQTILAVSFQDAVVLQKEDQMYSTW